MRQLVFVFALLLAVHIGAIQAQEYTTSIVGTDFDIITDADPSCFRELSYQGIKKAEMPDKTRQGSLFQKAHLLAASYSDGTEINIAIDTDFDTKAAAMQEALRYATRLGKLPTVLRAGVNRLVVHHGHKDTTAFSDEGLIVIYSANATKRVATNDLEETLFHESVHAAWDKKYANSPGWRRAQDTDGTFATLYARKKPQSEDLAESALFAYALTHHADRIPTEDRERISKAIPARILFIEKLIPSGKPIFFDVN